MQTTVTQIPLLSTDQIAQFKRDGYLILPSALDPSLCARIRDQMWETLAIHMPRWRRNDPETWTPATDVKAERFMAQRPANGGDP